MTSQPQIVLLRGGGVSLAVELAHPLPRILHWGGDLGELSTRDLEALRLSAMGAAAHNAPEQSRHMSILPTEAVVWSGTDELAAVRVRIRYRLDRFGILAVQATVTRASAIPYAADFVLCGLTVMLPVPGRAAETLDFTGKWSRERSPQRRRMAFGTQLRESRRGWPSLDSPYLVVAGTESFGFRSGEVWATHVGWSGNQRYVVEQLPEGAGVHQAALGGGELMLPGEIVLGAGGEYQAPTVYFAWSAEGLDGVANAFHSMLRDRPGHPVSPRPLTLNTWEAVYFNHDLPTLLQLIDAAAAVGVERLVLDDGWFEGRRNDRTGLGDWFVDKNVWPEGLWALVNRVRSHGMQFGLWFEPAGGSTP